MITPATPNKLKILFVGDIVGAPGRAIAARITTLYKSTRKADLVILNAENAAAGRGITPNLAQELFDAGADFITMGDHVWDQKDSIPFYDREPRIIRALNLPPGCPGHGVATLQTPAGTLAVIQLLGRTFINTLADSPFLAMDAWLKKNPSIKMVFVDFHAEATSEKIAMKHYLDGRITALAGTHTHVPTADEQITPKGTAYITDLGMTGPHDSVIGRTTDAILTRFLTGMPTKFDIATGDVQLNGALITVDLTSPTPRATAIKRIRET